MSRKDIIATVVGVLLVATVATFAVVWALDDEDEGGGDLASRVTELEERLDDLENRLDSPFRLDGDGLQGLLEELPLDELDLDNLPRLEDLPRLFEGFDNPRQRQQLLGQLRELFGPLELDQFNLDEDFLEGLEDGGLFEEGQFEELLEAFETLRDALEQAQGR